MMENNASRYDMNTMIISAYQMVFPRVGQNSGILSFQTPIAERIRQSRVHEPSLNLC